jgi:lytic murein transglycosylase
MRSLRFSLLTLALFAGAAPALADGCHKEATFDAWLDGVRAEARAAGDSDRAISDALDGVSFDPAIVKKDRAQGVFTQDFLQFSDRMVAAYRITEGKARIAKLADVFQRIEKTYGVPAPVLTAFWGLETDFGAFNGDGPTLTSLATLGYDCRRPDLFRRQLLAAIKIIDRGDLSASEMRGPWAGELGQLQFIPERYLNFGVDFDGDGHVDLLHSAPDALASAANYIRSLGWKAGQPWLQEVRVPDSLPWEKADLAIKLPLSQWSQWGVTLPGGKALPDKGPDASLFLPMGRNGPAFLAYPNFDVYLQWNNSLVYSATAAYFATRLAGAPAVGRGTIGDDKLSVAEVRQVQAEQLKNGMPADSYPSRALLQKLTGGA